MARSFQRPPPQSLTYWIVKVPVTGTSDTWDELGADALRDEALVLSMLGALGMGSRDIDGNGDVGVLWRE